MINKLTLIGRLGQDPEVRTLESSGTQVARMSVATSDSYKDKDGNWQETTEWHNVIAWRDLGARVANYKKGSMVYVEGKVTYRKYTDNSGNERTATDIVASVIRKLDKSESSSADNRFPPAPPANQPYQHTQQINQTTYAAGTTLSPTTSTQPGSPAQPTMFKGDDDLPF